MVSRELKQHGDAKTKGEQLFRDHGFTGPVVKLKADL
jgi:triphosphoribosyl-dephospho-CoA synthase